MERAYRIKYPIHMPPNHKNGDPNLEFERKAVPRRDGLDLFWQVHFCNVSPANKGAGLKGDNRLGCQLLEAEAGGPGHPKEIQGATGAGRATHPYPGLTDNGRL